MSVHRRPIAARPRPALRVSALAFAAALIAGCSGDDPNAYVPPPPPKVVVATPVERDVTTFLTYTGVVEASETVDLRARVQGFLESIHFRPGQRVNEGDLLFVIDKRQYQTTVDAAQAAVESKSAALSGADYDARLARELADQRAGPEIDALIKAARRDVIRGELAEARARLADAKLNLEFCEVRAPISGRIGRNLVDVGNLVGRGEPTLLAEIVQATPAFVSIDASESDVLAARRDRVSQAEAGVEPGQVSAGQWRPSQLALSDDPEFRFSGVIDFVSPQLDRETGTLRLRTRYENADEALIPGLFARVRFATTTTKAMLVPEAALLRDQLGRYALIVNQNNEVETRRVRIGAIDGPMRVVEEGLKPDDRVIVLGVLMARPGSKVEPTTQEPAPAGR